MFIFVGAPAVRMGNVVRCETGLKGQRVLKCPGGKSKITRKPEKGSINLEEGKRVGPHQVPALETKTQDQARGDSSGGASGARVKRGKGSTDGKKWP